MPEHRTFFKRKFDLLWDLDFIFYYCQDTCKWRYSKSVLLTGEKNSAAIKLSQLKLTHWCLGYKAIGVYIPDTAAPSAKTTKFCFHFRNVVSSVNHGGRKDCVELKYSWMEAKILVFFAVGTTMNTRYRRHFFPQKFY